MSVAEPPKQVNALAPGDSRPETIAGRPATGLRISVPPIEMSQATVEAADPGSTEGA